jgi:aminoglycoside phosphotransferase (APT) family kinase protein
MRRPPPPAGDPLKLAEGRDAEIFSWDERSVLRLYRDHGAAALADCEMAALDAVRTALPCVPAPLGRVEWQGRPGIVLERLDGQSMLAEIASRPWRVLELAMLSGRVHAEVHALRGPSELPDLRDELRRRIAGEASIPLGLSRAALDELDRLPEGDALCHGDFHPDNVLLCASGPAVIDWPNATRGDACGDFARTVLMLRVGAPAPGAPRLIRWAQWTGRGPFMRAYVRGYRETRRHDDALVRRWQLVRAVDRLADGIAEERQRLLRAAERLRRA